MNEPQKHTLSEALKLEIERTQSSKEEPPELWAPKMDQVPPTASVVGQPIPPGVVIVQHAHPDQMKLALKPLERGPSKTERQAFDLISADHDRNAAVENAEKADADWWSLPFPVPEHEPLPPDLLLLSDAAKELGYQTTRGFMAYLRQHKYPPHYKVISWKAMAELLQKKVENRRKYKTNWKTAKSAKPLPEPIAQAQEEKTAPGK